MSERPPHPGLKLRTFPGRFEVWLEDLRIARAQELHDGTWVAAVRPLRNQPEKAVIVESEAAARERLQPWCREHAWTSRPNVGSGFQSGMGKVLPHGSASADGARVGNPRA